MHEQIGPALSLSVSEFFLVESTVKCMPKLTSLRVIHLQWVRGHYTRAGENGGTEETIICYTMAHSSAISHRFTTVIVMRKAKGHVNNKVIDWLMVNPSPGLHCCF